MKIAVIGGHGLVGKNLVRRLRIKGFQVTAISRASGVDITTGVGLANALCGTDVVVDVSNSPLLDGDAPFEFFKAAATHVLEAELDAGVRHHVALSVVGTERLANSSYFRGKALQGRMIRASGIPFTMVHATQFFEFLLGIIDASLRDRTLRLAPAYIQPVASDDVAAALAHLAVRPPANGMVEVAGPERERLSELIQRFLMEIEAPYDVVTDMHAPYFGAMLKERSLLPTDKARLGAMNFGSWFDQSEFRRANW